MYKKDGYRLSPTERASVSAISLRHLATSGESRRYVVAFTRFADGGIWLPQESLRHILASPGYARPWDNRGKCYMDGKTIQCWSNASQHTVLLVCSTFVVNKRIHNTHLSSTVYEL